MGKPDSLNLRKRVVSAIEGGMSRNQAAKQFGFAISTAIGWMQRVEDTGSVLPATWAVISRGRFRETTRFGCRNGSRTEISPYGGLVAELAGRGLKVDYHSVWDFVHAEKLSFKKKRGGWRTRSNRGCAAASPVDKISRSRRS